MTDALKAIPNLPQAPAVDPLADARRLLAEDAQQRLEAFQRDLATLCRLHRIRLEPEIFMLSSAASEMHVAARVRVVPTGGVDG